MKRKVCYNVSIVEKENLHLLKVFVSHWLSGFCSENYELALREDTFNASHVFLDVTFSNEKDHLVAVMKDFPPKLAKFRVLH